MDYQRFDQLCSHLIKSYQKINEEAYYKAEPCADEASIKAVENRIGMTLPKQLRDFFLNYSQCFEMNAFLPEEFSDSLPKELKELFAAHYVISLEEPARTPYEQFKTAKYRSCCHLHKPVPLS